MDRPGISNSFLLIWPVLSLNSISGLEPARKVCLSSTIKDLDSLSSVDERQVSPGNSLSLACHKAFWILLPGFLCSGARKLGQRQGETVNGLYTENLCRSKSLISICLEINRN